MSFIVIFDTLSFPMHDVCAGYIVNDWGDVKLDKFVDDPMTASNVRRPRAVGAANKKVRFINTAVDYKKR